MPTLQRLLLAAFLLAPLALHAQTAPSKLDAILARGALRVGVTGDYRPFALLDKETGAFSGIDIDMANSLARGMGVKLELVQTAWGSLLPDLAADKFDVGMGGISVSLERQKTAFFSIPVLRTGKTPIARCENQAKFDTLAEIDQPAIRVITNPGGTNERYDRANLKAAQIIVSPAKHRHFRRTGPRPRRPDADRRRRNPPASQAASGAMRHPPRRPRSTFPSSPISYPATSP